MDTLHLKYPLVESRKEVNDVQEADRAEEFPGKKGRVEEEKAENDKEQKGREERKKERSDGGG